MNITRTLIPFPTFKVFPDQEFMVTVKLLDNYFSVDSALVGKDQCGLPDENGGTLIDHEHPPAPNAANNPGGTCGNVEKTTCSSTGCYSTVKIQNRRGPPTQPTAQPPPPPAGDHGGNPSLLNLQKCGCTSAGHRALAFVVEAAGIVFPKTSQNP